MPDLKDLLDRALPDTWEADGSPADAAMRRGSRIRRRRRVASTAAILGSFLAVVLLASSVVGPWHRDDSSPARPSTIVKLPILDSDEYYYWSDDWKTYDEKTKLTEPYDKALNDFLTNEEPDLIDSYGTVDFSRVGRQLRHDKEADYLASQTGDKVVHRQPRYYTTTDTQEGESTFIDVIPNGGFTAGSTDKVEWEDGGDYMGPGDAATHLIACDKYLDGEGDEAFAEVTAECEQDTGPHGQKVIRSIETRTEVSGDGETTYFGTVVLYRDDGTAVRIRVDSERDESELHSLLDTLTELAAALPSDPVR